MRLYTLDAAEADLRAAVLRDDEDAIAGLADVIDNLTKPQAAVSLHAAALYYAEQGLRVFPLQPGSKVPFKGSAGCKDATSDLALVGAWWTDRPDANIGIATGHLVDVIDIDGPVGVRSWVELLATIEADGDESPVSFGSVLTPRPGGRHIYVPAVPGRGNRAALLPGVDHRGAGGYVVAPPSRNEQGTYRWLYPLNLTGVQVNAA